MCPGEKNEFATFTGSKKFIRIFCHQNKIFKVDSKRYPFSFFRCLKSSKSTARRNGNCLNNFTRIEIGFQIHDTFISILKVCRNDLKHETLYVKLEMDKSIAFHQNNYPRPSWETHGFFQKHNINNIYKRKHQLETLTKILNSETLAQTYLKNNYLSRGHLSAKADFVYGIEQNLSMTYINAAPQWYSFNNGNWRYVENAVRKFVVQNQLNLIIYTGVYGHMTIKDKYNENLPLYLDIDLNNRGYIKVPKFFWKIIYDHNRKLAVTIVCVNDPFRKFISKDMLICQHICSASAVGWLTGSWNTRKNIWMGVCYVCSYRNLKKSVSTLPHLKVEGLLYGS